MQMHKTFAVDSACSARSPQPYRSTPLNQSSPSRPSISRLTSSIVSTTGRYRLARSASSGPKSKF